MCPDVPSAAAGTAIFGIFAVAPVAAWHLPHVASIVAVATAALPTASVDATADAALRISLMNGSLPAGRPSIDTWLCSHRAGSTAASRSPRITASSMSCTRVK